MYYGRVFNWTPDPANMLGGRLTAALMPLERLNANCEALSRLCGRYVCVRNGGAVNKLNRVTGEVIATPIGNARPNSDDEFVFNIRSGGGRVDRTELVKDKFLWRYIQASHFGEVNAYFHIDRMAAYIDELLRELGASSLPQVKAVVNAHHAATESNGLRDGLWRSERWLPFQGGHYRLPARNYDLCETESLSPDGEIHFGPGWQLLDHGALVEAAGRRYRANASHNPGIIYHEYGHHIARHTADFRANALRRPDRQNNRKPAIDEAICDYWTATMLGTPHIWACHRRHDEQEIHPRSLSSTKTMLDYDHNPGADPHTNGTIWAAALWDLRTMVLAADPCGVRKTDLLVLKSLLLIGQVTGDEQDVSIASIRRARASYSTNLKALLRADELLFGGMHQAIIREVFFRRGIKIETEGLQNAAITRTNASLETSGRLSEVLHGI